MSILTVTKLNEAYVKIHCDSGIARELSEYFSFYVPGYRFMPSFRSRMWDGKARLFNLANYTLYFGLLHKLKEFCDSYDYTLKFDDSFSIRENKNFSEEDCKKFLQTLNLSLDPRDYQITAITHSIQRNRAVLVSPTGSGKSFIIYALTRFYNKKTLIIVPTVSLVHQMLSDFKTYAVNDSSINIDEDCYCIHSGKEKISNTKVVISTWQSIFRLPKSWFEQFNAVVGDECLSPDTNITMGNGSTKKIKDVCVGDIVQTYNEQSQSIENKPVLKVHKNLSIREKMYEVILNGNSKIKITGNHKVLLTNGEWKRVDELKLGDHINSIK